MKIARVFPVRTKATPDDHLAFVDCDPGLFPPAVDEVHISVAFSWHKARPAIIYKKCATGNCGSKTETAYNRAKYSISL